MKARYLSKKKIFFGQSVIFALWLKLWFGRNVLIILDPRFTQARLCSFCMSGKGNAVSEFHPQSQCEKVLFAKDFFSKKAPPNFIPIWEFLMGVYNYNTESKKNVFSIGSRQQCCLFRTHCLCCLLEFHRLCPFSIGFLSLYAFSLSGFIAIFPHRFG